MSSQPRDPVGEPAPAKPKWYSYWPVWRRMMMAGALTLLAGALVPAIMGEDKAPTWVSNSTLIIGYGLLAYGFFKAMRARGQAHSDEIRWTGRTKDGWEGPPKEDQAEVLEEES